MRLTPQHLKILKAISKGKEAEKAIKQELDYSDSLISYFLEELEKDGYVRVWRTFDGTSFSLTHKGKVAIENPDYLIPQDNLPMSYINISGSNNIGGIIQNSNDTTVNVNQTIDQNTTEILNSINSLYESVSNFPEDRREMATVHLDDLKEEIEKPERRNTKKIRAYFMAFLGIALPLLIYIANTTDFLNNLTDLANKFNFDIKLPIIDSVPQHNQLIQKQINTLADEVDQAVWATLKPKFIK